jgi:uncharacterized tellurite resistance protein B-like protein
MRKKPAKPKLADLDERERLQLLEFVCAFAWADLVVRPEEWQKVKRLMERLEISDAERERVLEWLVVPPEPDDIDPESIPEEHRRLFLRAVEELVAADRKVSEGEFEQLATFRRILGGQG